MSGQPNSDSSELLTAHDSRLTFIIDVMDPSLADSDPREARMLAAIVFTDVVGFSKLASTNEARVYVALQRDMAVMTNLCRAHGGQVLNTMGDGMLLCFTSAVDALGCAVEIQRTLYNQSLTLPSVEVLKHRIGVHLGDVIMNGDNVFGDGVNVAARLQTLAQPGAVCFSRTVHEVVKNKLKVDAIYLGPQRLKNIAEPVPVWQVPPLHDTRLNPMDALDPVAGPEPLDNLPGAHGMKGGLMVLASVCLVAMLVFVFIKMRPSASAWSTTTGTGSGTGHQTGATTGGTTGDTGGSTTGATTTGTTTATTTGGAQEVDAEQVQQEIRQLRSAYRFNDIVDLLNRKGNLAPDQFAKLETYRNLGALGSFVDASLAAASPANPIRVARIDGLPVSPLAGQVYKDNGEVIIQTSDGQFPVDQLNPTQYLEVASAAVKAPMPGQTPPPQSSAYVQQFATEFNVAVPE